jgi:hypothetical protein
MKRIWIFAATLVLLGQAGPLHAATQTWFGFQVGVSGGHAPPAPVVFRSEPRVVVVNDVQVVDDDRCSDDVFRSDNMWWRMSGGYWYRSNSWRGPWVGVDVRRVPERVLVVPARNWKHPPRRDERTVFVARDNRDYRVNRSDREDDDHDNGRHRGRDRGHGRHGHGHDGDDN